VSENSLNSEREDREQESDEEGKEDDDSNWRLQERRGDEPKTRADDFARGMCS